MAVICLCCGSPLDTPRSKPITVREMMTGLLLLRARGHTVEQLTTDPEYIETLELTAPGFVVWLRENFMPPTAATNISPDKETRSP
jgi:hypothetical protein